MSYWLLVNSELSATGVQLSHAVAPGAGRRNPNSELIANSA
jgi:hypothetical protein